MTDSPAVVRQKEYFEPTFIGCGRGKRFWTDARLSVVVERLRAEPFQPAVFDDVHLALTGQRRGTQGMVSALLRHGYVRRELVQPGPRPKRTFVYQRVMPASEHEILEARQLMGLEAGYAMAPAVIRRKPDAHLGAVESVD